MSDWINLRSKRPPRFETVLVTDCNEVELDDKLVGPRGSLDRVWTAFYYDGKWTHNHRFEDDKRKVTFWKPL